jgi:hypothetical protein
MFAASDLPFLPTAGQLHAPRAPILGLLFVSALYSARMGVVASKRVGIPSGLGRVVVRAMPSRAPVVPG